MNTSSMITALAKLDTVEEELNRKLSLLKKKRLALNALLLAALHSSELNAAKSKAGRVWIGKQEYPDVTDWDKFYAYVRKNNAFDLLHKRVGIAAVKERLEAGKPVPGVHIRSNDVLEFRRN